MRFSPTGTVRYGVSSPKGVTTPGAVDDHVDGGRIGRAVQDAQLGRGGDGGVKGGHDGERARLQAADREGGGAGAGIQAERRQGDDGVRATGRADLELIGARGDVQVAGVLATRGR
jgi:hypothetical protein